MSGKFLGKISKAEYGTVKDYPFLMGLQLDFEFDNCCGIGTGSKYTTNMTKSANRKFTQEEQNAEIAVNSESLYELLKSAKCNFVSQLKGKPVEIEIDGNLFKGFRILTEVL